jgi:competence protein CoiA
MLLAVSPESPERVLARPGATGATCPGCAAPVIPKCGELVTWHWAHRADRECDPWAEHETPWHLEWKRRFPLDWIEVTIGPHRADVRTDDETVLEFQHSAITPAEIREREAFYERMVWLFDATAAATPKSEWDLPRLSLRPEPKGYTTFRWTHPRRSLAAVTCPLWLDLGEDGLLEVKRLYLDAPCGGWGYRRSPAEFVHRFPAHGQLALIPTTAMVMPRTRREAS